MKREYQDAGGSGGGGGMGSSEDKMMVSAAAGEGEEVDELLAALGYKVRASDMADVAQKLEQLEMAMGMGGVGAGAAPDDSFATHLATDTVHYNPTDLSSWVESMLSAAAGEGEEVDELLAALGYKVRASDMADVAQKLEQLEMAMGMGGVGAGAAPDDSFATHLATDTVHYNPTDLSSWAESMLSAAAGEGEEVDELLAALGYKVRASDMADVAQKLEQLEMAMGMGSVGAGAAPDDSFATHLATDTVHYNPTDLSSWVESMLSELNAPPPPLPPAPQLNASTSSTVTGSGSGYFDLPPV